MTSKFTLRSAFAACLLCLTYVSASAQLAAGQEKYVGSILDGRATNPKPIPPRFHEYWNQVTSENAGKWGFVEGERDVMDWTALDEHYQYAKDRGMPFQLHAITRREQEPGWLNKLPAAEIREEVEEWIRLLSERYPDANTIDVINEGGHRKLGSSQLVAAMGGEGASGWDAYVNVYKLTRKYFPNATLMLNDYSIIEFESSSVPGYDELVRVLVDSNVLDALGLQGHFLEYKSSRVNRRIDEVVANSGGLPVYITEFDLNISNDEFQKGQYEQVFKRLYEHPSVKGITLWGYEEDNTWLDNAYLLRKDGTERPALVWLREYLRGPDKAADRLEAEAHDAMFGFRREGGSSTSYLAPDATHLSADLSKDSSYASFRYVEFSDQGAMTLRYRATGGPFTVSLKLDDPTAAPIAVTTIAGTDDTREWTEISMAVPTGLTGNRDVFVQVIGADASGARFDIDWIGFGEGTPAVLAFDFSAFTAEARDGGVDLAWTTALERNVAGFTVERSSDGQVFAEVDSLDAAIDGEDDDVRVYSFRDSVPLVGVSYYRVRVDGVDGTVGYSDVQEVEVLVGIRSSAIVGTVAVFPNPSDGQGFTIRTPAGAGEELAVSVTDVTGRVVLSRAISEGGDYVLAPARPLPTGIYQVVLRDGAGHTWATRVVVR